MTADVHHAGTRLLLPEEHAQQSRLARAVRTLYDDTLAGFDDQAQAADCGHVTGLASIEAEEVAHLDGGSHRRSVPGGTGSGPRSEEAATPAAPTRPMTSKAISAAA